MKNAADCVPRVYPLSVALRQVSLMISSGMFLKKELKHTAPVLWTVLNAAGTSLGTTYVRKHVSASGSPACVMAAGILLNQ